MAENVPTPESAPATVGPSSAESLPHLRKLRPSQRTALMLLFSTGLAGGIVWLAGPEQIMGVFTGMGWKGVLHLLSLYTLVQLLRAMRFTVALETSRPGAARMIAIVCVHQFLNHVLPARLGELSFPLLASRHAGVSATAATHVLVVVRVYELVVLSGFFVAATAFLASRTDDGLRLATILAGAVLALLLIFLLSRGLPALLHSSMTILDRIRIGPWQRSSLRLRVATHLRDLHQEFLRPRAPRQLLTIISSSVAIWIVVFWLNYQALRYAGIDVNFPDAIVGSTFANASHVLPINSFGSVGSLEAGWTFGFVLVGVPAHAALASGFALHIIGIVFLAGTGLIAWIGLQRSVSLGRQR